MSKDQDDFRAQLAESLEASDESAVKFIADAIQAAAEDLRSGDAPEEKASNLPAVSVRREIALSAEPASPEETRRALVQLLQSSETSADDIFRHLAEAMAAQSLDPVILRIRYQSDIKKMVSTLSAQTRALTSIAQALGIKIDGTPVAADPNFANWPEQRLAALIAHLQTSIGQIADRESAATARANDLERTKHMLEEKIAAQAEAHKNVIAAQTFNVEQHRADMLEKNTLLAAYTEEEAYLVAEVDSVTRTPQKFIKLVRDDEGDSVIKGVKEWKTATRFKTFARAKRVRYDLLREMHRRSPKDNFDSLSDRFVVLQICMRAIDLRSE